MAEGIAGRYQKTLTTTWSEWKNRGEESKKEKEKEKNKGRNGHLLVW
jgi:hypothetical protein